MVVDQLINKENAYIFATSSHPELARLLSEKSNIPLVDYEPQFFANGEYRPNIGNSIRGKHIYIVSSPHNLNIDINRSINDHVIELFILMRTCKRCDVQSMTLIMPCYAYARQDKKDSKRGAISASDMADLYKLAGITRIICFDLHAGQIQGFFGTIPCDNIYTVKLIHNYFKEQYFRDDYNSKYALVAPDEGAVKRTTKIADQFNIPMVSVSKSRNDAALNIVEKSFITVGIEYIKGRTMIILDDMADTCGTIVATASLLKEHDAANIIVVITHGIFSGLAIERLKTCDIIDKVITTNTLPQYSHQRLLGDKLEVLDISELLNQIVLILNQGSGSISEIFE